MLFSNMSCKFTFGLFLLWMLISGCATERTIAPAISGNETDKGSITKVQKKIVQKENADQSNDSEPSSSKLKSNINTENDDGTFKIVTSGELHAEEADHFKKSPDSKEDANIELANDQRERQIHEKPVEIEEIKKKKENELDERNSQITGNHSNKEDQSEISDLKTINDQHTTQDSSISIENEKGSSLPSFHHGSKVDPSVGTLTTKSEEPRSAVTSSNQENPTPSIQFGESVIQEENDSTIPSVGLGEVFDSPVARDSEKIKPTIIFSEEQKVSEEALLRRNVRLGLKETSLTEKENNSNNELNLKKAELGISNKSNDHENPSVGFKSFLGQDTERNGDNSLRQINLKDLDADSPNNTLNQETSQNVALKNNREEGSDHHSLELDKNPVVSLSESRNYGAIKKFVAGDRLQVDRNSSTSKDSRNFGKIREWSSQSRDGNFTSPLEEKNAKQYDRAKEWIRNKGRVP